MVNAALSVEPAADIVTRLRGRKLVCTEFMYRARSDDPRERAVFDFTLATRLAELRRYEHAAVLFLCNNLATVASLAHLPAAYPNLTMVTAIVNSEPVDPAEPDPDANTPTLCGWDTPDSWQRYTLTDRWARLLFALDIARQFTDPGYLILPAHDAVWGSGLLAALVRFSQRHAQNGLPAAVSPYTYYQHSEVPGVDIPREIIDALNAAFGRDSWLRCRFRSGRYQSFWGKMGMIPFGMCGAIRDRVETIMLEDDLEIDAVIRGAGYKVRCQWVDRPSLYRQALPIFDRADLKGVIERTLHYSLMIPGEFYGEKSLLNQPLDRLGRLKRRLSPRFDRAVALSETIIAECNAAIADRLDRFGMSWVDWGPYRYVVRVGDARVQVWKSQ